MATNFSSARFPNILFGDLVFLLARPPASPAAERFDDITVGPQSLASGETYHGYRELRIQLENRSVNATHRVTLIYPDRSYAGGNSISRMSRTVSLGPSSTAIVPMWQPPLAAAGNGNLRVLVDGSEVGKVGLPDPPRHLTHVGAGYGGSMIPATFLVSRSLNYDEVGRALKSERSGLSASRADGPPDYAGPRGPVGWGWSRIPQRPDRNGSNWNTTRHCAPTICAFTRLWDFRRLARSF